MGGENSHSDLNSTLQVEDGLGELLHDVHRRAGPYKVSVHSDRWDRKGLVRSATSYFFLTCMCVCMHAWTMERRSISLQLRAVWKSYDAARVGILPSGWNLIVSSYPLPF